jgi:hypothetical protein
MKMLRLPAEVGITKVDTALNPDHVISIDALFRQGTIVIGECAVTTYYGQLRFKCSQETAINLWEDAKGSRKDSINSTR